MISFRRSLVINFFSSTGATVVQFIVSLVLARMLSPSDIGIFSMTVVFVNIAHIFRDFGVSSYLQREATLTPQKIASASGVMITSSWSISLLLFLVSPWISQWFLEPAIAPVMQVLALGFLFIPFGAVTNALLVREYAAGKEVYLMVAGTSAYTITCLGLASLGFGTMSMAWANLANIIACAVASIPLRPKGVPWMPSFKNWGNVVHFGFASLLGNCLGAINNAIPDILLGKLANARAVGLFSRAGSTVTIFSYVAGSTINYGTLPYISKAYHRGDPLSPILSKAGLLLTGIGWPALAITALLGKEIILTLYGAKWLDCVPAIAPLAIAAGVTMAFNYTSMALLAIGRPYLSAAPTAVILCSRIAIGIALFNGSIRAFAWAICCATIAAAPVLIYQQRRYLGHGVRAMFSASWPSLKVTVGCMVFCELIRMVLPDALHELALILAIAAPLSIVWYWLLRWTGHPLVDEIHLIGKNVRSRFPGSA